MEEKMMNDTDRTIFWLGTAALVVAIFVGVGLVVWLLGLVFS